MNKLGFLSLLFAISLASCINKNMFNNPHSYTNYQEYPVYTGADLGVNYSKKATTFKLWTPSASEVLLRLYDTGSGGTPIREQRMTYGTQGVWEANIKGDIVGDYYTFQTKINGQWQDEVPDPYVKAVGLNGQRGQVVDLASTNPIGWAEDKRPSLENFTDIILYELHFRDLSMHSNSGIKHKGKFLGLTETGTTNPDGLSTGLDHIKELGVTHVHILPSYDFLSTDESKLEENNFNWGYDPQNYNVPDGSYSTNPDDGTTRIKEFKQMVKTLHDNGLRVILDVVYNHTGATETSNFNQLVPGYYYRQNWDGSFSNASGCGNETASDRPMMRKFMLESVKYWVEEYHLDGFRFDLMGIHDMETMRQIARTVHAIDPSIFIYGEGWTGGDSPLPEHERALKKHIYQMPGVAAFSDDIRDGIKGHVFTATETGFASGKENMEESVKFGVIASTRHPQVDYSRVNYSDAPWADAPTQTINYVSCHDNYTLWDKLLKSQPHISKEDRIKMHLLSNTIVLTAQGVPFLHAGVEMLRTKEGEENSFESPDEINRLDWSRKTTYKAVFDYYQDLIALRKAHPAFRMPTAEMIYRHLQFLDFGQGGLVGFVMKGHVNGDSWRDILVVFNGALNDKTIPIPDGEWNIALKDGVFYKDKIEKVGVQMNISGSSALILYKL